MILYDFNKKYMLFYTIFNLYIFTNHFQMKLILFREIARFELIHFYLFLVYNDNNIFIG